MNSMYKNHPELNMFNLFGRISLQVDILHCVALINSLQAQRNSDDQCDFTIYIKNDNDRKRFNVHRCLLIAISKTIEEMRFPNAEIELDVTEMALERFINFLYTGKINALQVMTVDEVTEIWKICHCLEAAPLQHYLTRERPDVTLTDTVQTDILTIVDSRPVLPENASDTGTDTFSEVLSEHTLDTGNASTEEDPVPLKAIKIEEVIDEAENETAFPATYSNGYVPVQYSSEPPTLNMECHSDDEDSCPTIDFFPTVNLHDFKPVIVHAKPIETVLSRTKSENQKQKHQRKKAKKKPEEQPMIVDSEPGNWKHNNNQPQAKKVIPKALEQCDPEDISMLKELKLLAPHACIWNVLPDL